MTIVLVPAAFFVPGLLTEGPWAALGAVGYVLLGLLAVVPMGFVLGSVFKNPRSVGGWGLVLIVWAVAGLVPPPILLRRMARRESGSSVTARREKALQRV